MARISSILLLLFSLLQYVNSLYLEPVKRDFDLQRGYDMVQKTGAVRKYDWTVARGVVNIDGTPKDGLLINGQYPGPKIEANLGDTIQVTVRNKITGPEEGTSFHWHGLLQRGTPYQDGVPSITQCPIAPGKTLTYTFLADSFGTSFYHSHYSAQYMDGLVGPLVIHGPKTAKYDIDLGPVILSDYFYKGYIENLAAFFERPLRLLGADRNLINYRTDTTFKFETGKIHKFGIVNAGAEAVQRFSIDDHEMTVIALDFVPIKPYKTKVITLGVGQRFDVLVKATGKATDAVWMRSNTSAICTIPAKNAAAQAKISYPKANGKTPSSTAQTYDDNNCNNDPPLEKSVPFFPSKPQRAPSTTTTIKTDLRMNETGFQIFFENDSSFRGNYNTPILPLAAQNNQIYKDPQWNTYNYDSGASVRIVLTNANPIGHPMHLHGHEFWVLAEGFGDWDGKIVNPNNPARKDTHVLPPALADGRQSFMVIEFLADNPGIWALHCHVVWHVSMGLYVNILEAPAKIPKIPKPKEVEQTCKEWDAYSKTTVINQFDSGVKA